MQKLPRLAPKKPSNPVADSSAKDLLAGVEDRWLLIGTVGKPHGLRGAFFVSGRSEPVPKSCKKVSLGEEPSSGQVFAVAVASVQQDRPVMALESVTDRTAIEAISLVVEAAVFEDLWSKPRKK